ncbi:MAG: hypothetical protein HQL69_18150 [Magnetococcales bacterium]|nr:hypothetical protein [Magnetococcales bacterium]
MNKIPDFFTSKLLFCLITILFSACSGQIEKVSRIESVDTVCSRHDETGGIVVVLQLEKQDTKAVCNFLLWDSKSLGRIMQGINLKKLKPYRHELYPDLPYYSCDFS